MARRVGLWLLRMMMLYDVAMLVDVYYLAEHLASTTTMILTQLRTICNSAIWCSNIHNQSMEYILVIMALQRSSSNAAVHRIQFGIAAH